MQWNDLDPWGHWLLAAATLIAASQLAHRLMRPVVRRAAAWSPVLAAIVRRGDRPMQWVLPLAALQVLWQGLPEALPGAGLVQHANGVLLICALTSLGLAAVRGTADGVIARYPDDLANNLSARRVRTQTNVLARIGSGAVLVAGLAFILMSFPRAHQIGASLLASAGVAGLVVGLAAKSVVGNLLAGLQIALAQPIRIDDVLIVEGEWGRVEEITATYVVLRIWDDRRLIIPLGWFSEHPFQNWTRTTADLLGSVFLWVDYALPLEPLRAQARRLCEASPNWDGRVCLVQVTEASERAMQLRVLVSSSASGPNFDLRCELREGLLGFIQREYPQALPRLRSDLHPPLQP
ncbi:mechanosensitive ion channel family protein [Ideonella sp.]|uniref:mechanosensitive ion channel family protein n=1 Tax=Ideonella sp. TaxID=1929293 RepID=UPI002B47D0D0|nr:mechanosensitive ion channel domain-containing protein [Ideonella sp.]HJV68427.1 mechanosensitive ion channel domain-containing protein [Ideonella sp.]